MSRRHASRTAAVLATMLALVATPVSVRAAMPGCDPCSVEAGTYRIVAPPEWDGSRPLGLLVVFHGYAADSEAMTTNERLTALAAEHDRLMVAPDGAVNDRGRRSWSHQGSPSQMRDVHAFLDAVLADVRARFPIADAKPVVAGFSQGGSMVWDVACRRGGEFADYVAVSGGFWEPMPERCAAPVGRLVHVHGLDDPVVPLEGRPIGDHWRQADIFDGLDRFKRAGDCAITPDRLEPRGALHCRTWSRCEASELTVCLHPGGHAFELAPLARVLDEG